MAFLVRSTTKNKHQRSKKEFEEMDHPLETRTLDEIRPHTINAEVFGAFMGTPEQHDDDEEFLASIKANGIIEPLVVSPNNKLISGHRRLASAKLIGLATVPVIVKEVKDEFDLDVQWCECNLFRRMTPEQKVMFYEKRLRIEKMRKAIREHESDPEAIEDECKSKRPEELAAAAVGASRETMRKGRKVVRAITEAAKAGRTGEAEQLRATLNSQSITAAAKDLEAERKRKRKPAKKMDSGPECYFDAAEQKTWKQSYGTLVRMHAKLAKASATTAPLRMSVEQAKAICGRLSACLEDFLSDWKQLNPGIRWT